MYKGLVLFFDDCGLGILMLGLWLCKIFVKCEFGNVYFILKVWEGVRGGGYCYF